MSNRRKLRPGPYKVRLRESAAATLAPGETAVLGEADKPAERQAVALHESNAATLAATGATQLVQIISEGWGSSGHYSTATLQEAAGRQVFGAGLAMYLDHPTATEEVDRPERSVRDLAAHLAEDAHYDPARKALVARVNVLPHYQDLLTGLAEHVGLSIRAGGVAEFGEADGRRGMIVKEITEARSVDYVTKAGRGGKVLALMESARKATLREAATIGSRLEAQLHTAWTLMADDLYGAGRLTRDERIALSGAVGDAMAAFVARVEADAPGVYQRSPWQNPEDVADADLAEAMTDDTRRALHGAIQSAHGAKDTYVWVRDFDPDNATVIFETSGRDETKTWRQSYAGATDTLTLSGTPTEVVARTEYEPVGDAEANVEESAPTTTAALTESAAEPQGQGNEPTTTTKEEGIVPETTDDTKLREAATAAEAAKTKAEAERETALKEAADAKQAADESARKLARFEAVEAARPIADQVLGGSDLPAAAQNRVRAGVLASDRIPLTESLALDETALRARLTGDIDAESTYLASLREAAGEGQVKGAGNTATTTAPAVDVEATRKALVESYKARGLSEAAAERAARGRAI